MQVRMDHVALYVRDLEGMRAFYVRYLAAEANGRYENPRTGLQTYFLSFSGDARLEIMQRPDVADRPAGAGDALGYAHLAFQLGSRQAVDQLTQRLAADGYRVVSPPRVTGDGYYESCILDPEGNPVELVA